MTINSIIRAKKLAEKVARKGKGKPKDDTSVSTKTEKKTKRKIDSDRPESKLKGRHYSTITNREITREVDRLRKMARRTMEDPLAVDTGAEEFFKMLERFEKVVEDAGMSTRQTWSNLRKHSEIIHRSFVDELKKFGSWKSVSVKSGRLQAQYSIDTFGEDKWMQFTKDERSQIWRTVKYYTSNDYTFMETSDQVIKHIINILEDPKFDLSVFNSEFTAIVDSGEMEGEEIYLIPAFENRVERTDEAVEERRKVMKDTISDMRSKRRKRDLSF